MNRRSRRAAGLSSQALEELHRRAEASGCDVCGARFAQLLPYAIARLADGGLEVRCLGCLGCLGGATLVSIGAWLGDGDPWSVDDREWFAAHPARRLRLRDPFPGELAALALDDGRRVMLAAGERAVVATLQLRVGRRIRHVTSIGSDDPLDSYTDPGIARLVPAIAETERRAAGLSDDAFDRLHQGKFERRAARLKEVIEP